MRFDDLEARMRTFETASDLSVLPGVFMVARVDGRSFTRLTKDVLRFEAPYDVRFRDGMISTLERLMDCGFGTVYGYTQSDEISLLFRRDEASFGRKLRKLCSVLAGEASAALTFALGTPASFDCRVSQLPTARDVVDYFRWRAEDATRNALAGHCYWLLRRQGMSEREATNRLSGASVSERNELLFESGINFNTLPAWQKRGIGASWEVVQKAGTNPKTNRTVTTERRKLTVDMELPTKDDYTAWLERMVSRAQAQRDCP
jgi:tRNA(His) 5'-end guanylyltransferase